jgi:hypothetical protein
LGNDAHETLYEGSLITSMHWHPSFGTPLQLSSFPATSQPSAAAGATAPLH